MNTVYTFTNTQTLGICLFYERSKTKTEKSKYMIRPVANSDSEFDWKDPELPQKPWNRKREKSLPALVSCFKHNVSGFLTTGSIRLFSRPSGKRGTSISWRVQVTVSEPASLLSIWNPVSVTVGEWHMYTRREHGEGSHTVAQLPCVWPTLQRIYLYV